MTRTRSEVRSPKSFTAHWAICPSRTGPSCRWHIAGFDASHLNCFRNQAAQPIGFLFHHCEQLGAFRLRCRGWVRAQTGSGGLDRRQRRLEFMRDSVQ